MQRSGIPIGNTRYLNGVKGTRGLRSNPKVNEKRLVNRLKKRDESAFTELVMLHKTRVFNVCYRMLSNTAEAEDIAQDVFVRAFIAIKNFRGDAQLSTWLYRIAINLCKNRIKYHSRRHGNAHASLDDVGDSIEHKRSTRSPQGEPEATPDKVLEGSRAERQIQRALAAVPDEFRELLVLRDVQGLTYGEIVVITGLPEGTVKSRLHRARGALKKAYDAQEDQAV